MRNLSRTTGRRGDGGGGFNYRRVSVVAIDYGDGMARCQDQVGQEFQVTMRVRSGKGGWPQAGEEWFISKQLLGRWIFVSVVSESRPPVISAPREGMDKGTEQIFDALLTLGLVSEEGSDYRRSED